MITKKERKATKEAIHEEKEAVRDYSKAAKSSKSPAVKKAFKHALSEEKQHAKMFGKVKK